MTGRRVAQVVAGGWTFVVLVAPAIVIWWAGEHGSLGDLSELELLTTGIAVAVVAAVLAGVLMGRAIDLAAADPRCGRLDPWAALFAATTVLGVVITLLPATALLLLLPEEDRPIGARVHWVALVWVVGAALTALLSVRAGRAVLVRKAPAT